ncbi:hypothetical protein DXT63_16895 [Thermoanaerobacteraceae bacterium SP2]|nr:hypothetical protein DXT63_16895 [Thermoanaerobacteraceae bacterium SP2]
MEKGLRYQSKVQAFEAELAVILLWFHNQIHFIVILIYEISILIENEFAALYDFPSIGARVIPFPLREVFFKVQFMAK